MSRSNVKTVPCDSRTRAARLVKAQEFLDAADEVGPQQSAPFVALCVLAGIAAADVVCCALLGEHAIGSDHGAAVELLATADRPASSALQKLLALKSKAEYSSLTPTAAEATRAHRAAAGLLESATMVAGRRS